MSETLDVIIVHKDTYAEKCLVEQEELDLQKFLRSLLKQKTKASAKIKINTQGVYAGNYSNACSCLNREGKDQD